MLQDVTSQESQAAGPTKEESEPWQSKAIKQLGLALDARSGAKLPANSTRRRLKVYQLVGPYWLSCTKGSGLRSGRVEPICLG